MKRVYLYENQIVLQAENPKYSPLVYTGEDMNKVRIIGRPWLSSVKCNKNGNLQRKLRK